MTCRLLPLVAFLGLRASFAQEVRQEPDAVQAAITVESPLPYQVFQRSSRLSGAIHVRGTAGMVNRVEVRVLGTSLAGPLPGRWTPVSLSSQTHGFEGDVATGAGGFYDVEVRATDSAGKTASRTIRNVGVGEVFVIAGQSNSTNYGEVRQHIETGMVTSFDGSTWVLANDPQPGVQDNSRKGSFVPAFGDALFRKYHVPIGIASVGHGSTSVRQWLPASTPVLKMPTMTRYVVVGADGELVSDGTLFRKMMARIQQLGPHGFRAILWHQGESDCHQPAEHEIPASSYAEMLQQVIRASRKEVGWDFPWFVAIASYHTPADTGCADIRDAQRKISADGLALEGPDTDTLTSSYRQNEGKGTHFNDAGLKAHGLLWADVVSRYLEEK